MTVIAALIISHLLADSKAVGVAVEHALSDVAPQLPEMEWCNFCSYDEACEPGMPREVVNRTVGPVLPPVDWDERWGQGPPYEVTSLACGHLLAQRC
ncbi:hypothetical protein [Streptomyces sp. NBC_00439]|uniref:hypothetical protein n=1 Tax=Streptomyces sp. NBC_00439 TaxID=2903650 RepID=UPI00224DB550|nr:hypothetical protein [Streptomyces sp. NBC_00439]MCX5103567.1 hypothetical protein [Streptomyces sp. NBC_00439]